MGDRPYLSIGEVLGMLLEEFPDVSISKIRFLESQGLIDPERTPSGYRKFYDADVDRLRVILREQRQNFLPLRVIRDRLESGQIDDSGPMTPPRGLRNVTVLESANIVNDDETGELVVAAGTIVPTAHHPSAQPATQPSAQPSTQPSTQPQMRVAAQHTPAPAPALRHEPVAAPSNGRAVASSPSRQQTDTHHDALLGSELCARAGITSAQLKELVTFGLVAGAGTGPTALFSAGEVAVVIAAAGLLARGVDARHLRQWRRAAEHEAALFEQLIVPLIRQRNPQSRQLAANSIRDLSALGGELRAAFLTAALQQHLEP